MNIKLAEALLRRKELNEKVVQLKTIKENKMVYEIRAQRVKVTESIDNLDANYPKLDVAQVTAEYDYYARALRLIDGYIQQANWTHDMKVDPCVLEPYKEGK